MKNITVFKRTINDWYPSYILNDNEFLVDDRSWRITIWGKDDFGLEKEFDNEILAWQYFVKIIKLENITISDLKVLGFKRA